MLRILIIMQNPFVMILHNYGDINCFSGLATRHEDAASESAETIINCPIHQGRSQDDLLGTQGQRISSKLGKAPAADHFL
jgi:hypothetical protein